MDYSYVSYRQTFSPAFSPWMLFIILLSSLLPAMHEALITVAYMKELGGFLCLWIVLDV